MHEHEHFRSSARRSAVLTGVEKPAEKVGQAFRRARYLTFEMFNIDCRGGLRGQYVHRTTMQLSVHDDHLPSGFSDPPAFSISEASLTTLAQEPASDELRVASSSPARSRVVLGGDMGRHVSTYRVYGWDVV